MAREGGEIRFRSGLDERGFTVMHNIVLLDTRISHPAYRTLNLLMYYARQDARCWPGQEEMAQRLATNVRSVQRYLAELDDLGLITVERRGNNLTNLYWIEDVRDAYLPSDLSPITDATNLSGRSSDATKLSGRKAGDATVVSRPIKGIKNNQIAEEESTTARIGSESSSGIEAEDVVVVLYRLVQIGITRVVAERLLKNYGLELVERQLEWIAYRDVQNKAAALVSAIKEDWAPPPAVAEAQEREAMRLEAAEREREKAKKQREAETTAYEFQQEMDRVWGEFSQQERDTWRSLIERSLEGHVVAKPGGMVHGKLVVAKLEKALRALLEHRRKYPEREVSAEQFLIDLVGDWER